MAESSGPLKGRIILVIDDEQEITEMLSNMLSLFGAAVVGVTSIEPAGAYLLGVDVVIIDMMLKGKKNGVEVGKALRAQGYDGPLVAISASDQELKHAEDEDTLFAAFINKPFDITSLTHVLTTLLD